MNKLTQAITLDKQTEIKQTQIKTNFKSENCNFKDLVVFQQLRKL